MLRKIREAQKNEEGFTLIELLVVVIIIGILAAIAIPAFLNQRERAYQAELSSTLRNVALEVEAAATVENGDYADALGADLATQQAAIEALANGIQGADADPVVITIPSLATGTEFCMTAQHVDLGTGAGEPNQAYDSDNGGLSDYSDTGAASC